MFWIANGKTKVAVYTLVQHCAHTSTVQLYCDVFWWRPPPPQNKQHRYWKGLSCHTHVAIFRVRLQQKAVYVITATYGSVVLSALKMVVAATETCRHIT